MQAAAAAAAAAADRMFDTLSLPPSARGVLAECGGEETCAIKPGASPCRCFDPSGCTCASVTYKPFLAPEAAPPAVSSPCPACVLVLGESISPWRILELYEGWRRAVARGERGTSRRGCGKCARGNSGATMGPRPANARMHQIPHRNGFRTRTRTRTRTTSK